VLVIGAILCQGPRTVTAVLRVLGLGQEPRLERSQRVWSRARGSGLQGAKSLLGRVLQLLLVPGVPMRVVDDPVERRRGKRINAKGCYREAGRSTATPVVKGVGLKWLNLMGWVRLPWCSRPWAWPVLTLLAPSEPANRQAKKRPKPPVEWTCQVVKVVSRWLRRPGQLLGEGALACRRLGWTGVQQQGVLISRWRLDAHL
jgi:hypothetical protein